LTLLGPRYCTFVMKSRRVVQMCGAFGTKHLPVGTAVTKVRLNTGEWILLKIHEAALDDDHSTQCLIDTNQLRNHYWEVGDDIAFNTPTELRYNEIIIPLMVDTDVRLRITRPSEND